MKRIFSLLLLGVALSTSAQEAIPEAVKGQQYGAGVSDKNMFNVYTPDQIIEELESKENLENVVIRAKVTGVCEKRGCWLDLENTQNKRVFVKMKDYAFFLPMSILGKTVLIDGEVHKNIISVKELRHYAEDAKNSKKEIKKIKKAKTEYRVISNGIKVID